MNAKILLTLTLLSNLSHAEVNLKDGSYYKTWVDLEITKQDNLFELRRTYNSRSLHPGLFGYGWCSDFEKSLELRRSDQIVLRDCKLKTSIVYHKIKSTLFRSRQNPQETLEIKNHHYLRKTPLSLQKYNKKGQLVSLSNHSGFHLEFTYSHHGTLQKIHINKFAEISIKMDAHRRHIQHVFAVGHPRLTYHYEGGTLRSVQKSGKETSNYRYDEVYNLIHIGYPDRTFEKLTYNKDRDWILNIQTRDKCQETFQWTLTGPRAQGRYQASAQRTCRGRLISQTKLEFLRMGNKIRVATNGGLDESK